MSGLIRACRHFYHSGNLSLLKAATTISLVLALAVSLTACEKPGRPSATNDDFVGIWLCYESKTNEGTASHELGKGFNQCIAIQGDGTATVIITTDGTDPVSMECKWHRTIEDKQTGEDSGIVLVDDQYTNPFTYYEADEKRMKPHFVDERLVRGNLVIDYGYRKDYFEKVSNDPNDTKWLPDISKQAASSAAAPKAPEGAIEWTDAPAHVGETVTVRGPIVGVEYAEASEGSPTFIDMGAAYPDTSRVTVVVWGADRESFPYPPETIPVGETFLVTGEIYLYEDACYIKATSPEQIEQA